MNLTCLAVFTFHDFMSVINRNIFYFIIFCTFQNYQHDFGHNM